MPSLVTPFEYELLIIGGIACLIGGFAYWLLQKLFK
jgi:hypothetical protein